MLLPVIILMFLAGTVLYTPTAPVVPALHSYWLGIHVSAAVIASGILLLAGVSSVLYLIRAAHDEQPRSRLASGRAAAGRRRARPRRLPRHGAGLPDLDVRGDHRGDLGGGRLGPLLGLGPEGDHRARRLGGLRLLPARAVHRRLARAAARRGSTWSASRSMVFNLFFVNIVVTGLHSYAGVG